MNTTITHVAPAPTAPSEQARASFWSFYSLSQAERAMKLRNAVDAYKKVQPYASDNEALAWVAEGSESASPGSLFNLLYLSEARQAGFLQGNLTYLYDVGRALRQKLILKDELELLSPEQLRERLKADKAEMVETARTALKPQQEQARALLAQLDPHAPTAAPEAEGVILAAFNALGTQQPALTAAAVHAARTGDLNALNDLAEATTPLGFIEWGVWNAHDFVSGELRTQHAPRHSVHHIAFADKEARPNDDTVEMISFVQPHLHVNEPFSDRTTAHSRAYTIGLDAERQVTYCRYLEIQHRRHEAFIRGEADPYPVLPAYARLR